MTMKTPGRALLALAAALAALPSPDARGMEGGAGAAAPAAKPDGAKDTPAAAALRPDPAFLKKGDARTFSVSYVAKVKQVPEGTKKLRVWVPVPQDGALQTIVDLKFDGAVKPTLHTEKMFGNRIAYFEVEDPKGPFEATVSFTCTRRETVTDLEAVRSDGKESADLSALVQPDRLGVVDDRIRKMAADVTAGRKTTLEKARAIYDFVSQKMTYDKSGKGWGRGDTAYACDVGKGNCTDFHALFISLCRAEKIPCYFEIGLYLPYDKGAKMENLGGYHCWAYFRVPGKTWVPVDISEADRNPARMDYFFGSHTCNRVTLSAGRDLVLEPAQAGEPLNYFLAPYAEADGKPVEASKDWMPKDID